MNANIYVKFSPPCNEQNRWKHKCMFPSFGNKCVWFVIVCAGLYQTPTYIVSRVIAIKRVSTICISRVSTIELHKVFAEIFDRGQPVHGCLMRSRPSRMASSVSWKVGSGLAAAPLSGETKESPGLLNFDIKWTCFCLFVQNETHLTYFLSNLHMIFY